MNSNLRSSNFPVNSIFLNRVSARTFSERPLTLNEVQTILEAGRFAPSAQNNQPWHFAYTLKNDNHWESFFELLASSNQEWCVNASALVIAFSTDTILYNHQPKPQSTHSLDTGLAIQNMLLQASEMSLVAHPMAGFNKQKVVELCKLPTNWHPECMIALGTKGDKIETITDRKRLQEISTNGFPNLLKI